MASSAAPSSAVYGLKCQARSITSREAQTEAHHFFIGTCSAKEDNEVHIVSFDEDANDVRCEAMIEHKDEVWSLTSHPKQLSLFASTHGADKERATLWKIPDLPSRDASSSSSSHDNDNNNNSTRPTRSSSVTQQHHDDAPPIVTPQPAFSFTTSGTSHGVRFDVDGSHAFTLDDAGVALWSLDEGCRSVHALSTIALAEPSLGGCWDPHHSSLFTVAPGTSLHCYDTRMLSKASSSSSTATPAVTAYSIPTAHDDFITDIDYNPNKPYQLMTSSFDRCIHQWDIRRAAQPLLTLASHSHWVWMSKYNRFHDQLIVSAGTEVVNLWLVVSTSSAPLGDLEEGVSSEKARSGGGSAAKNTNSAASAASSPSSSSSALRSHDKLIKSYDDHENSIYSVCWSSYDAWVFASISYDGRVVVNQVPPAEKYKILL